MDCVSCHRSFIGKSKLCVDCQLMESEHSICTNKGDEQDG